MIDWKEFFDSYEWKEYIWRLRKGEKDAEKM